MAKTARLAGTKRLLIDKANATMLVTIAIASFIVTFSLVGSKTLIGQSAYQSRVIKEKTKALTTLQQNNANVVTLVKSYQSFASEPTNILDGNPAGTGPKDGDNPKIVLDALPSKYDFPALISSQEKLLKDGGYKIEAIGGNDDELAQQSASSDSPAPVAIPYPVTVTTNYSGAQNMLLLLERSIRPIYVTQLSIAAASEQLRLTVSAKTFYQPEKTLKITTKVVK